MRAPTYPATPARATAGLCIRCGRCRPVDGASSCGNCLEARRSADRRAAWVLTRCSRPSFGASRCEPCAERAWQRSKQVKGLPVYRPSFTVVERGTGIDHGVLDTWEEVAIALSFSPNLPLSPDLNIDSLTCSPTMESMRDSTRPDLAILAGLYFQNEKSFVVRRCVQRFLTGEISSREAIARIREHTSVLE